MTLVYECVGVIESLVVVRESVGAIGMAATSLCQSAPGQCGYRNSLPPPVCECVSARVWEWV